MDEKLGNASQAQYWSDGPGRKWVQQREPLDALMAPVLDLVLEGAGLTPGAQVLDIGCGTGTSTIEIAQGIAPGGRVVAVDIAASLLDEARIRADGVPGAHFILADAQTHAFELGAFDMALSRFGVMFFSDPVQAFRNIASALKPGCPLIFAAWCGVDDNPWFGIPAKAAMDRLGSVPPSDPRAPGPMAFQDGEYVTGLLTDAGLREVSVTREEIYLTPDGTAAEVAALSTRIGPATRVIKEHNATKEDIAAIQDVVCAKISDFETPEGIRVPAAIHICTAHAPG
ncbi:methyltransferase domain-containing protein [Pseudohalocynthiibacter aestuariivivens]|uniref:Class I SAM-dependent methyltransferase n=1 Tax=Roseovarius pelagicus TaxID=2980108 RepID=A0ABY6DAR0_9RHOB|nr:MULTISPECIES: class I SAM-dependent methyltransferase [Rhodobacterales]QIE45432.1 methyltransferase domain-containing protein [Pseudohalocynthiibacter aestuariivivens]UXX82650.1 class I SAM-dependent methyltransferase [Roseovarius pelagicus]